MVLGSCAFGGRVVGAFGHCTHTFAKNYIKGIWPTGIGVVLVVIVLFLIAGYNNTAYYPSTAELQSSLTIKNSCSSEFTLTAMFYASLIAPFVLGYIFCAWRSIDSKKIDRQEIEDDDHAY